MGSTSSVAKMAAAIAADNGVIHYALFEQTYEHNVHPRTPHWGCIFFGDAPGCMSRIIDYASNCEGGMLQENGRWVTPSAYIKHWREAMAKPYALTVDNVIAENGKGFYYNDTEKQVSIAKSETVAASLGRKFVDGKLTLNVRTDAHIIQALIEAGTVVAWRMFGCDIRKTGELAEWAAYEPGKTASYVAPKGQAWHLPPRMSGSSKQYFILDEEDKVVHMGWDYWVIGKLITSVAKQSERVFPGSAETAIRHIRKLVEKDAPLIPGNQIVKVTRAGAAGSYNEHQFDCLINKLNLPQGESFQVPIGRIYEADAIYKLECCSPGMLSFPGLNKTQQMHNGEQLSLHAA